VRDRRKGPQSFYGLVADSLPAAVRTCLDEIAASGDPTLDGDQARLRELEAERRGDVPEHVDDLEREYSPGRSWQSLTVGIAALLRLGDVLDVGSGDGAAAAALAPYCRSLTCVDTNERLIGVARERLARHANVRAQVADAHALPFDDAAFDGWCQLWQGALAAHDRRLRLECAREPGGDVIFRIGSPPGPAA